MVNLILWARKQIGHFGVASVAPAENSSEPYCATTTIRREIAYERGTHVAVALALGPLFDYGTDVGSACPRHESATWARWFTFADARHRICAHADLQHGVGERRVELCRLENFPTSLKVIHISSNKATHSRLCQSQALCSRRFASWIPSSLEGQRRSHTRWGWMEFLSAAEPHYYPLRCRNFGVW